MEAKQDWVRREKGWRWAQLHNGKLPTSGDEAAVIPELSLGSKGFRGLIDPVLYVTVKDNGLKLLTRDEELRGS